MRCETSFFSLTLFKKYLTRYWPMWAVWTAIWTLAIPVNLWNSCRYGDMDWRWRAVQELTELIPVTSVCIAVAAPIAAVAVFFYLFRAPAANFVGALPMQREGAFFTAFLAGYVMLTVPLMAVCLFTLLVEWALGAVAVIPLLKWLGGCMLASFFWFSFATLCCVISGNMVASVCFYGIFNGVVAGMAFLLQTLLGVFLYGFDQFGQKVWEAVMWLTPIYKHSLNDYLLAQGLPEATRFEMLWVYAAVGFLMALAALGLHHIRKAERAGDLIAFGPIRWLFRISVTVCGGLAFGMLLMVIIFSGSSTGLGAKLAGCCAVAAMVSWFAAEMLLQKSFKVFKGHWRGAVAAAVCFILAICAIDMDWIGFSTRVPQLGQVHAARAEFAGEVASDASKEGLVYDAGTVEELIALHQYIVDHKDDLSGGSYGRLEVEYDLGLTAMRRVYHVTFPKGGQAENLFRKAQQAGQPAFDAGRALPSEGYVNWDNEGRELTEAELAALWAAVKEDVEAGRYRAEGPERPNVLVEFNWRTSARGDREWDWFYPTQSTTSVNAVLETLPRPEPVDTEIAAGGEEIVE